MKLLKILGMLPICAVLMGCSSSSSAAPYKTPIVISEIVELNEKLSETELMWLREHWNSFDPIGVAERSKDEYDFYLGFTYQLIGDDVSEKAFVDALKEIVHKVIGMPKFDNFKAQEMFRNLQNSKDKFMRKDSRK